MATFIGHLLPGVFLFSFGFWWAIQMFHRYYKSQARNTRFTSTSSFSCGCLCGKFKDRPVEGYVKVFFVSLGIVFQLITGFPNGHYIKVANVQHVTMFFFFGLIGAVDIMLFFKCNLPPGIDYVSIIMALFVEFIIFRFHLHGRSSLDVLVHTLLIYTICLGIVSVFLELKYRNSILVALSRSYLAMLQGSWFVQVGWILYPPFSSSYKWDEENHDELMIAAVMLAWHAAITLLLMFAIGGTVSFVHKKIYRTGDGYSAMKKIVNNNGETVIHVHDETESETEFQEPLLA